MKLPSNEDISKAATGNCTFLPSFIAGAEWMREIAIERSKCETLKQSPWIRPQDQMPEKGEVVLITDKEGMQIVAWIDMYNGEWHSENHRWWPREVVYWMPIPQPPKPLPMPWIRPKDQMPEDCQPVLITDVEGLQIVAWYITNLDMWHSENHSWFPREVNYWMPIPEIV